MEVISQDAIVKMFEKCSALPRYRVGFCFSTERAVKYWDESIEYKFDDKIQNYFSSLLISYHGIPIPEAKHTDWTDSADTTELDAFLNSFRITHNI